MGILSNEQPNPTKRYIQFSGSTGEFSVYNKETKEKDVVPMPITFASLKDKITVSGGIMEGKTFKSVYSNIIDSPKEVLSVKIGQQEIARGTWAEVKDKVKSSGGKYTVMAYALMDGDIVCFKLSGAALGCWFDKGVGDKITFDGTEDNVTGAIKYKTPLLTTTGLKDSEVEEIKSSEAVKAFQNFDNSVVDIDEEAQADQVNLNEFNENLEKKINTPVDDVEIDVVKIEDVPF